MEKKGNIDGFNSPSRPYGNQQHKVAPAGAPPGDESDPNSQKGPLSPTQNPDGPGYPAVVPQGPQAVVFVQPTAMTNPPDDYLGCSIFVTVCCCWIIGAFAIVRSTECRAAIAAGDRATAEVKSRQAMDLIKAAFGLIISSLVIIIVICGVYYGAK